MDETKRLTSYLFIFGALFALALASNHNKWNGWNPEQHPHAFGYTDQYGNCQCGGSSRMSDMSMFNSMESRPPHSASMHPSGSLYQSKMVSSYGEMVSASQAMQQINSCAENSSCVMQSVNGSVSPSASASSMSASMSASASASISSSVLEQQVSSAAMSSSSVGNVAASSMIASSSGSISPSGSMMVSQMMNSMNNSQYWSQVKESMSGYMSHNASHGMSRHMSQHPYMSSIMPSMHHSMIHSSGMQHGQRCLCPEYQSRYPDMKSSKMMKGSSHMIKPSKAMSSMMKMSSAILDRPLMNYTELNSKEGFTLRRSVAIAGVVKQSGEIEMKVDRNAQWQQLSSPSASAAIVLPSAGYLRFVPSNKEYYGVAKLSIVATNKLSGTDDTTGSTPSFVYILIEPEEVKPRFNGTAPAIFFTIDEDSPCQSFQPSKMNSSYSSLKMNTFDFDESKFTSYMSEIDADKFGMFKSNVEMRNNYTQGAWLRRAASGSGRWFYTTNGKKKPFEQSWAKTRKVAEISNFALCFVPAPDVFGFVELLISPAFIVGKGKGNDKGQGKDGIIYGDQEYKLVIKIRDINDRPIIKDPKLDVKALPYNMSGFSNTGFQVSQLLEKSSRGKKRSVFADKDGDTLGIAVISAKNTSYGSWEYKCGGGSWTPMDIQYNPPLRNLNHTVLLLTPTDSIRFLLQNESSFWSQREAFEKNIQLQVLAWDQTDNQTCGTYLHTGSDWPASMSMKWATGMQLRKGCDGRPGFVLKIDVCGTCGGDGKRCRGCDGGVNSGAKIDSCGVCYGGSTNKTKNSLKDCGGSCGKFTSNTTCGNCIRVGDTRNYTDCNGDCFGRAKINKCGICTGGKTGRAKNHGEDACGICGGDNTTCVDCAGTPNGKKKIDLCKLCLLPDDANFNAGCSKLGDIVPNVFYKDRLASAKATISRSGPIISGNAICSFYLGEVFSATHNSTGPIAKRELTLSIASTLSGGNHNVRCDTPTGGDTRTNLNTTNDLMIIDPSTIAINSVSSSIIDYATTEEVTVTGTGFMDTKQLACLFIRDQGGKSKKEGPVLKATYVSSTQVTCQLKPLRRSVSGKLVVSFVDSKREEYLDNNITLHRSANLSSIKSATFSTDLGSIWITFHGFVGLKNKTASCQDIFPQNYTSFGAKARCFSRGKILAILLMGDATIGVGALHVDMTQFVVKPADYTVYPESTGVVDVALPPGAAAPKIKLVASRQLGRCDDMVVKAKKRKGGGRKLTYTWSVSWSSSNTAITTAQNNSLTSINQALSALPGESSIIKVTASNIGNDLMNVDLDATVTIRNFLGLEGNQTIKIRRENKDLPKLVLNRQSVEIRASQKLILKAKAKLPGCGGSNSAQMDFLWSLSNADGSQSSVVLAKLDGPRLIIPAQSLAGGSSYIARVDVSMVTDPSLTTYDEVKITVKETPLVARISGRQTVGQAGTMKLSAKKSRDPDGASFETTSYSWQILTREGGGVVFNGSAKVLSFEGRDISFDVESNLEPGQYKATLTYRVGSSRKAESDFQFTVDAGSPPELELTQFTELQNPSERMKILAKTKSQLAITAEPEWVVSNGVEGIRKGGKRRSLYIIGAGTLDEDTTYDVTVTVSNSGATSESVTTFITNSRPIAGAISIEPTNGTEFSTKFALTALETHGWFDPDGDELVYECGVIKDGVEIPLRQFQSDKSFTDIVLEKGSQEMYIKSCDSYDACATETLTLTVDPVVVDAAFRSSVDNERIKLRDMKLFSESSGIAKTGLKVLLSSLNSPSRRRRRRSLDNGNNAVDCANYDSNTISTQTSSLEDHLTAYETGQYNFEQDPSSRTLYLDSLAQFTTCGSTILTSNNIKRTYDVLVEIIEPLIARTPTQIEAGLKSFDNIITTGGYDSNQQAAKQSYLSSATRQTQRMCLSKLPGEDAAIAKTTLATLQSIQLSLSASESNWTKLGCDDCTTKPSYVDLRELKTQFSNDYTCGDEQCSGACVASFQYPNDLYASSFNDTMLSHVLDFQLFDSSTTSAGSLNVTTVSGGIDLHIHVTKETNNTYKCLRWHNDSSSWVTDGVETPSDASFQKNSLPYVLCRLTTMAPVALFEGPERIEPTSSSISTMAFSSSISPSASLNNSMMSTAVVPTLSPQNYPRAVQFSFPFSNCTDQAVKTSKSSIQQQIADKLNISKNTMTNFTVSCGSIVIYYIQTHDSSITAQQAVTLLQNAITQNNLNITVAGQVLSVNQSSLMVTIQTPNYAITTTAPPTEDTDELSGGAIAGIVIGVLIFIIIVAVVVYFMCCKKNTRKDNQIEPNENDVELRGKSNRAYQGSP
ncbi:uncharacterized protein [Clytia hemisphaerica]|uniref:PKD/REJ-like domain-containing protein n=1 Tax=Clytia hemisphaerica TaxID=252671 RepID=A0A7M5X4L9_9CNID